MPKARTHKQHKQFQLGWKREEAAGGEAGRSLIPAVLANEIGVARPMDSNWKSRSWRIIRPDCGASSRETGVLWRQVKVKATETTKAQTIKQQTARKKMYIQSKN